MRLHFRYYIYLYIKSRLSFVFLIHKSEIYGLFDIYYACSVDNVGLWVFTAHDNVSVRVCMHMYVLIVSIA